MPTAKLVLWCVSVLMATVLLVRLLTAGLLRRYPWFATSLAFFVVYSLAVAGVPGTSQAYLYAYLTGEGLSLLLNILIIRECLDHLRESYPGAAPRYLRRVFAWAATIALGLCAISMVPDAAALHVRGRGPSFIAVFLLLTRSVNSSLTLCMLAVQIWAARYPSNRAPNLTLHMRVLTCYMATGAVSNLAFNLKLASGTTLSVFMLSAYCLWYALWCRMNRAGESPPPLEPITREERNIAWERFQAIGNTVRDAALAVRRKRVTPPEWER